MTANQDIAPAVVVGAGISGLGAAAALERRGIAPRILDADARPGETWRRRHPQLTLNTHRAASSLPGLPMPTEVGHYPHRDDVVDYVTRYACRLTARIEHGTRVERVLRERDHWRLETNRGPVRGRNVVVATGVDRKPQIPDWPVVGDWPGRLIHSADLGNVRQYAGKRVLVVGAGNSGSDVLNHLSRVDTEELMVSVRHGPSVISRWLGRFPMMRLTPILAAIPSPLLDPIVAGMSRLMHGDLTQNGLRRHPLGLSRRMKRHGIAPAIDDGMVAALKAGRLKVVPEIDYFRSDGLRLADFRLVEPDVVIAATGYRTGLEPMLGGLGALTRRGVPLVNGGAELPHLPGLFFTGMRPSLTGFFRASARSGAEIARVISHREREVQRRRPTRTRRPRAGHPSLGPA